MTLMTLVLKIVSLLGVGCVMRGWIALKNI